MDDDPGHRCPTRLAPPELAQGVRVHLGPGRIPRRVHDRPGHGGLQELYVSHPGTTYGNDRLSLPLLYGHGVASFQWTGDSSRLVYGADVESVGEFGLFSVNLADGTTIALTPPPVFGGAVVQFELR